MKEKCWIHKLAALSVLIFSYSPTGVLHLMKTDETVGPPLYTSPPPRVNKPIWKGNKTELWQRKGIIWRWARLIAAVPQVCTLLTDGEERYILITTLQREGGQGLPTRAFITFNTSTKQEHTTGDSIRSNNQIKRCLLSSFSHINTFNRKVQHLNHNLHHQKKTNRKFKSCGFSNNSCKHIFTLL